MKRDLLLFGKKGAGVLTALFFLLPISGFAGNITVSNTAQFVSALSADDVAGATNTITMNAGTYSLSSALIFGSHANVTLTITAVGTVVLVAPSGDRILTLNSDGNQTNLNVTVTGVTFENGAANDVLGGGAIIGGGPGNSYTFNNCVFQNNANQPSAGNANGGAVHMTGGGSIAFSGCTFSGNSAADGNGGAIAYFTQGLTGSLTVTGCTFSGNSTTTYEGLTIGGGAISISATGTGLSSPISITKNIFTGNTVPLGDGGAIDIETTASTAAFINYNRFYKNTAGAFPDVAMAPVSGGANVDITNNWWGRNVSPVSATDPHAGMTGTGGSGSLVSTPFLELTSTGSASSLCDGTGGNSTVVTAGFTKNSAGTTISSANLAALVSVPISFSTAQGSLTGAQATIQSSGTATVTFTDNGATGSDKIQPVVDSVTTADAIADAAITVVAPSSVATAASTSATFTVSGNHLVTDGSCNELMSVTAGGASPLSGSVTARVTIDASVQSVGGVPYVQRHYDVEPASGASTATATLTLYYLQSEFDAYNASVSDPGMKLPTGASDMTGRGNLTISQLHGTGTAPGSYTGWTGTGPAQVLITPGASNVVWNSTKSWWEVTFSVTGFSGFFVTGPVTVPLPVVLELFSGVASGSGVMLNWKVDLETGLARYEIQRSGDGVSFSSIGPAAVGARQFFDGSALAGKNFYRLRMDNLDGSFTYSQVIVVDVSAAAGGKWVRVLENPFGGACSVVVNASASSSVSMRIADASGKILWRSEVSLGSGANTLLLPQTGSLASGLYFLTVVGQQGEQTIKILKK